jgi:UDP-N-acetylglucosamine--N-acetylmuramyl-(pentapeptide) pyrophosphoryl-undecaprenol N-acetylglucosamine transferase
MKILISGGHLTPALAFCEYAQQDETTELVFVGREFSQTNNKQESVEQEEVEKRNIRFLTLLSGKLSKSSPGEFFIQSFHLLNGVTQAWKILSQEKPDIFVSFGSYLAVPLAIAAWLKKIPIVTHEQTQAPGFANRFIAWLATSIAISVPETSKFFPKKKTIMTGNPIRADLLAQKSTKPAWLPNQIPLAILYITGGSQGSQYINQLIAQLLPELTKEWCVIHQCGKSTQTSNYLQDLEGLKKHLPVDQQQNYFVQEWMTEEDLGWILQHMKLAISRAGANTVQEITLVGKPAIFIPLLYAHHDEQWKNAEVIAKTGAALLLHQEEATPETLLAAINTCVKEYKEFSAQAKQNQELYPRDGAKRLYELVSQAAQTKKI